MNAYREHFLQHFSGRLHVDYSGFDGPRTESLDVTLLDHGDGQILVPRHQPICIWRLVEKDSAHGKCQFTQDRRDDLPNARRVRKVSHGRTNV